MAYICYWQCHPMDTIMFNNEQGLTIFDLGRKV